MSESQGGSADPQDVPMAEEHGSHGAGEPSGERGQQGTEKAFDAEGSTPPPGEGREVSDEERAGVSATDTAAETPLGVGESINRSGEDVVKEEGEEAGKETTGEKDGRPVGTSDERAQSSVDPSGSGSDSTDQ